MEIETAATTIRIERALDQRKGQIEDLKAINALIGQQLYQLENIPIKFIKMATIDFTGKFLIGQTSGFRCVKKAHDS